MGAVAGLRLELSALQGLDLGVDPHLAQLLLNDHGGVPHHLGIGAPESGGEAVRIAGLGQQLLGLLHVAGVVGAVGDVAVHTGGQHGVVGGCGLAAEHQFDVALGVQRVGDGLPDLLVVKGRLLHVHAHIPYGGAGGGEGGDGRVVRQALQVGDAQVIGQVHLAGLQANGAVQRLGNRAEDDALDGRSAAPVVLKGLQDHVAAQLPGDELEGAGAHGVLVELLRAGVRALADDGGRVQAQAVQQRVEGRGGLDGDGVVVVTGDALDDEVVVIHAGVCDAALQAVLDILGGHLLPVVELDALAQMEHGGGIVDNLPALRQARHQVHVVVHHHQTVKHLGGDTIGPDGGLHHGIHVGGGLWDSNDQGILGAIVGTVRGRRAGTGGATAGQHPAEQEHCGEQCENSLLHRTPPDVVVIYF